MDEDMAGGARRVRGLWPGLGRGGARGSGEMTKMEYVVEQRRVRYFAAAVWEFLQLPSVRHAADAERPEITAQLESLAAELAGEEIE